jgi:hypothetical protein
MELGEISPIPLMVPPCSSCSYGGSGSGGGISFDIKLHEQLETELLPRTPFLNEIETSFRFKNS